MAGKVEMLVAALVTSSTPMNYQILPDIGFSDAIMPGLYASSRATAGSSISNMNMDEFTARMEHLRDQLQQLENQPLPGLDNTVLSPIKTSIKLPD